MQQHFRPIVLLVLVSLVTVRAQAGELPPDLAAVPANALAFVHIRAAEVWKNESLEQIRKLYEKAGSGALQALDERFVPAPSSVDRLTFILLLDRQKSEPVSLLVVATRSAIDRDKLMKQSSPDVGVHVVSDRVLILGPENALKAYLSRREKGNGAFAAALQAAAGKSPITAAVNTELIPRGMLSEVPPPLQPFLQSGVLKVSFDPGKSARIDLCLTYADAKTADAAEKAVNDGLAKVREMLAAYRKEAEERLFAPNTGKRSSLEDLPEAAAALAATGFLNQVGELLDNLPIKRDGNALAASLVLPEGPYSSLVSTAGLASALVVPAVQKVREAAARTKSANNLKQINLALLNYADTFNGLPPAAICDKKGKPLLSWRVAILPYIEQDALYRQFKLDEPWDSKHNIQLIHRVPNVYMLPKDTGKQELPSTHYLALVGNGAGFELKGGLKMPGSFPDGTSNTIWIVEAEKPVPWTKPEDIEYDPKKVPPVGYHWGNRCQVGFVDASVRTLSRKVPETTWHLLIQRNDGQPINPEDLNK